MSKEFFGAMLALVVLVVSVAFFPVVAAQAQNGTIIEVKTINQNLGWGAIESMIDQAISHSTTCLYPFPLNVLPVDNGFEGLEYQADGSTKFVIYWANEPQGIKFTFDFLETNVNSTASSGRATLTIPPKLASPGKHRLAIEGKATTAVFLPGPEPLRVHIRLTGILDGKPNMVEDGFMAVDRGSSVKLEWRIESDFCAYRETPSVTFASFPASGTKGEFVFVPRDGVYDVHVLAARGNVGQLSSTFAIAVTR